MSIHPTAIVDPDARLGAEVAVGPYAVIGAGVTIGDRCRIGPHACLEGPLEMGADNLVCFSAALGHPPQIKGKQSPFGRARIGSRNVFREFSQVQRALEPDGETVVGDDGYFMANSHVAHDCRVADHVVICNNTLLAGHIEVQERVFLSGNICVHQFSRMGELSMIGGGSVISKDVPPFGMMAGARPPLLEGLNVVGLRRAGFPSETRRALKAAYRVLFRGSEPLDERIAAVDRSVPEVDRLATFLEQTERGVHGFGGR